MVKLRNVCNLQFYVYFGLNSSSWRKSLTVKCSEKVDAQIQVNKLLIYHDRTEYFSFAQMIDVVKEIPI